MKKLVLLFVVLSSFGIAKLNAQCTPDTSIKEPGYYPQEFDPVVVGQYYKQVLQIRVVKDTNVTYNGFPVTAQIDSVNLLEIIGLPNTFNYECYNPTCSYIPSETGCAVLDGQAEAKDTGLHPLELVVRVYARVFSVRIQENDTIRDRFALQVNATGSAEIVKLGKEAKFYPNPSTNGLFELENSDWLSSKIEVYNQHGQLCMSTVQSSRTLDISSLPKGMYTYILTNKNGLQSVGRLVSMRH